jgi:heat shock protein HslJ
MTARSFVTAVAVLLAASALSGCASSQDASGDDSADGQTSPSVNSASDLEGEWRAEEPDKARLTFDADGAVRGTDGCNGVGGTASVSGDEVTFDLDLSTLRACVGVTTSFSRLGSAVVEGDVMMTRTVDGAEIVQLRKQ